MQASFENAGKASQAAAVPMAGVASSRGRDLRIDFFRGVALLVILTSHLPQVVWSDTPWFMKITPVYWALADMLNVFVFLSGYVFARVYLRVLEEEGVLAYTERVLGRCGHLYVTHLAAFLVALTITGTLAPGNHRLSEELFLAPILETPAEMLALIGTLRYMPVFFDILPLYIVLILVTAPLIVLMRRWPYAAFAISLALYGATQGYFAMLGEGPVNGDWTSRMNKFAHPLAWQFLFFAGAVLSTHGPAVMARLRRPAVTRLAVGLIGGVTVLRVLTVAGVETPWLSSLFEGHVLASKAGLAPLRLLYFMLALYLIVIGTRAASPVWRRRALAPLVWCGQHSLAVFVFGLVGTYLVAAATGGKLLYTETPWAVLWIPLGLAGSMAVGAYLHWKRVQKAVPPFRSDIPLA
jgi:hypothetical protein